MTFLDIDINELIFPLNDFEEIENCIPTSKDVHAYKEKILKLINKYKTKLSEKIKVVTDVESMNEIIKYDVICYFLYENYTMACEELVIDFDENFDEDEICSLSIRNYIDSVEYPKILNITYTGV